MVQRGFQRAVSSTDTVLIAETGPPGPRQRTGSDETAPLPVRIHRLAQQYHVIADFRRADIPVTADMCRTREVLRALEAAVRDLPAADPRRADLLFELEQTHYVLVQPKHHSGLRAELGRQRRGQAVIGEQHGINATASAVHSNRDSRRISGVGPARE